MYNQNISNIFYTNTFIGSILAVHEDSMIRVDCDEPPTK